MQGGLSTFLVAMLAAALLVAVVIDVRSRLIPNVLTLAIALAAIPFWWSAGLALWPDVAIRIGVAALVLGLFWVAFLLRQMGGGDVKLLAAVALWLPPGAVIFLVVLMSIAGGVLTAAMLIHHRLKRSGHKPEIPYGVAIAFSGLWLIGERFLNQFG